jgi:hypothetical protein
VEFTRLNARQMTHSTANYSYFAMEQDVLIDPLEASSDNYEDRLFCSRALAIIPA